MDYGNGALIDRSAKCELLVSAKDGKATSTRCKFCQKTDTDLKGEATFDHTIPFEEQKVKEEQVQFDNYDVEPTLEDEDEYAAQGRQFNSKFCIEISLENNLRFHFDSVTCVNCKFLLCC